jgi:hypothetical protein
MKRTLLISFALLMFGIAGSAQTVQEQIHSSNDGWVSYYLDNSTSGTGMVWCSISAQCWAEGDAEAGFSFGANGLYIDLYASELYADLVDYGSGSADSDYFTLSAYAVSHNDNFAEVNFTFQWSTNYDGF